MAVLLLTSAAGAPGVTTTALGLALAWPRDVLLVDADPHPARAVEAGYLRAEVPAPGGLGDLARAHRQGTSLTAALWSRAVVLPRVAASPRVAGSPRVAVPSEGDGSPIVRFLPGFAHPGQAGLFEMVWPAMAACLWELGEAGVDVVVDLGRTGPDGPPPQLCARAAAVAVVTRCGLRPLAGLALQAETLETIAAGATGTVGLVAIGAGRPYSAREVGAQFETPVMAELPEDARAAAVLSDGASPPRGWAHGRYAAALGRAASSLGRVLAQASPRVAS